MKKIYKFISISECVVSFRYFADVNILSEGALGVPIENPHEFCMISIKFSRKPLKKHSGTYRHNITELRKRDDNIKRFISILCDVYIVQVDYLIFS